MPKFKFLPDPPSNLKDEMWQVSWNCHNKIELKEAIKSFLNKIGVLPTIVVIKKKPIFNYADIWMWNPILEGAMHDTVWKEKGRVGDKKANRAAGRQKHDRRS